MLIHHCQPGPCLKAPERQLKGQQQPLLPPPVPFTPPPHVTSWRAHKGTAPNAHANQHVNIG